MLFRSAKEPALRREYLELAAFGLRGQSKVAAPPAWATLASQFGDQTDGRQLMLVETLGMTFGDRSFEPALRAALLDSKASNARRQHAFRLLAGLGDPATGPMFLELLNDEKFRGAAIPVISRLNPPGAGRKLIERFSSMSAAEKNAALAAFASRAELAETLLDAILEIGRAHV